MPPQNCTAENGQTVLCGETLPITDRTMRYRLSVRDNRGSDSTTAGTMAFADVFVAATASAGPFRVTAPPVDAIWQAGETYPVTWNVAQTNQPPVNAATVRIKLSLDGGASFPYVLASGVPNNGQAMLALPPNIPATSSARLMVAAEGNVFLDISRGNFQVLAGPAGAAPLILTNGVTSVTGKQASIAPGAVISIYGENLSATTASAGTAPLPTKLGTTSVAINGVAAPLFYVSPTQVNAQVPYEVSSGEGIVVVTSNGIASPGAAVTITQSAPGINQDVTGHAVVINANGTVNDPGNPARPGEVVTAYGSGQGPLSSPVATGAAAPANPRVTTQGPATVTVAGAAAAVQFSGLTPGAVGLWQINFAIPTVTSGNQALVATVGGVSSPAVMVSVSQ